MSLRLARLACFAAASLMLAASPAMAGRLGGGEELGISLGRIIGALLVSILVAVLAIFVLRQRAGKGDLRALASALQPRPRELRIVETRRVSQHADICLVRHGGREYLLLLMAGSARLLNERAGEEGEGEAP